MDVVVDELGFLVADILAGQVRTHELVVAMNQDDRAPEFGRDMKRDGGLAGAREARQVKRVADLEIGQRPLRKILDVGAGYEAVAGLREKDAVGSIRRKVVRALNHFGLSPLEQAFGGPASVS